jgi:Protein of unknown function (DUF2855)
MTIATWAIDIDRDDISIATIASETLPSAAAGQIVVAVDSYAMTANNVTYAVFGKPSGLSGNDQGYWDFFAERDVPGRLPVWGFATVVESAVDGICAGDRFYGFYPMASHALLSVDAVSPNGFTDVTARRTALPPIYNHYSRMLTLSDYRHQHHDYWPVFRPLFLTGWLIADQFDDERDYGAEQVLVASASSKTAIGFAYAMMQRVRRPQIIGLTSRANARALSALDMYDSILCYDDIDLLDSALPSALVDMAGNASVTGAVHSHFGDSLVKSIVVGKSHWDANSASGELAGAPREGFFAPDRSQKRVADWGARGFGERLASAWLGFMDIAPSIARIDKRSGPDAALAAYHEILGGAADPKIGIIIAP